MKLIRKKHKLNHLTQKRFKLAHEKHLPERKNKSIANFQNYVISCQTNFSLLQKKNFFHYPKKTVFDLFKTMNVIRTKLQNIT